MRVRKFGAPMLRKFLDTSLETMQLTRKISYRVQKTRNYPMLVDIKEPHLELFEEEGRQSSHGTGGGAWAKITNAKGVVTEKV